MSQRLLQSRVYHKRQSGNLTRDDHYTVEHNVGDGVGSNTVAELPHQGAIPRCSMERPLRMLNFTESLSVSRLRRRVSTLR